MYDKSPLEPCPVLRPSAEEFRDPITYLSSPGVSRLGAEYGIVKIVPPDSWKPPFSISPSFKFHTRLQKLSDLGLKSRSRNFFKDNINRFLKMNRQKPIKLSFKVKKTDVFYYDLYVAVEKAGGYAAMTPEKWIEINRKFGVPDLNSPTAQLEYEAYIQSYAAYLSHNSHSFEFPESDDDDEDDNCMVCGNHDHPSETLLCDNCDNPYHMACLAVPLESIPTGKWYCDKCLIGTGEYGFEEHVDIKYSLPQFYDMCQEFEKQFVHDYNNGMPLDVDTIETMFWQFVGVQKSDLEVKYGADIHNLKPGEISGFPMLNTPGIKTDDPVIREYIDHPFNLTKLPFAKGSLLNYINTSISGMTVPWIYIGTLLSTFCWHVEDHYTLSANYCHFGATKKWYGIPSKQADQFEKLMKDSAPDLFKKQPDLLHQLVTLLSPMTLVENGIKCVYADQQPNEIVVTYPRVYHSGFNCGFNFNEAVNFTMNDWLEYGAQSIQDYKLIKKENVFNHYQLIENIMREFNHKLANGITVSSNDTDLVARCLNSFERFLTEQNCILDQLDKSRFLIKYEPKQFKPRSFENEQAGRFEDSQDEEEEDLCEICKTHIAYQYCIINNKNHDFGKKETSPAPQITKEEETSPVIEALPKFSTSTTRIAIHQLLTPDSSPYGDHQKQCHDITEILASKAADNLSGFQKEEYPHPNSQDSVTIEIKDELEEEAKTVSMEAEYNRLIANAKRVAAEEADSSTRRKSRRIKELKEEKQIIKPPTEGSKMSVVRVQASIKQLNQKDSIRLCLECLCKHCGSAGEQAPEGSTLLYEAHPLQLKQFVEQTRLGISRNSV